MLNLPFNKYMTIELTADVDLNDGRGVQKDMLVGTYSFFSSGIVAGSLNYNTVYGNLGGTFATIQTNLTPSSNQRLLQLMTDLEMRFTPENNGEEFIITLNKRNPGTAGAGRLSGRRRPASGRQRRSAPAAAEAFGRVREVCRKRLAGLSDGRTIVRLPGIPAGGFPTERLAPSTLYKVTIRSLINQGLSFYAIESVNKNNEFSTLKREPTVTYDDLFLANDMAQFNGLMIEDTDKTVLTEPVLIEPRSHDRTVQTQTIMLEEKVDQITFNNLAEGEEYTVCFKAKDYNNGKTGATYQRNFVFRQISFTAGGGLNGSLSIDQTDFRRLSLDGRDVFKTNLISPDQLMPGKMLKTNGTIVDDDGYFVTGEIPIDLAKNYLVRGFGAFGPQNVTYCIYDGDHKVTQCIATGGENSFIRRSDLNAASQSRGQYLVIHGYKGYENSAQIIEDVPLGENLYDPDSGTKGIFINNSNGSESANASYNVTDYIPVQPGEYIYVKGNYNIAFYDAWNNPIGALLGGTTMRFAEAPGRAVSFRVCYSINNVNVMEIRRMTQTERRSGGNADGSSERYLLRAEGQSKLYAAHL